VHKNYPIAKRLPGFAKKMSFGLISFIKKRRAQGALPWPALFLRKN
jgi:hypothetical protein